ncbi:MAG: hypothetical protein RBT03_08075, partial [Kiritimatiellia bacterium]|nr:hypothetical protein [Kiritimatiellia bacterium]
IKRGRRGQNYSATTKRFRASRRRHRHFLAPRFRAMISHKRENWMCKMGSLFEPSENPLRVAFLHRRQHLVENGSPRLLRRLCLNIFMDDVKPVLLRQHPQLVQLRLNRQDLALLVVRALPRIDEVFHFNIRAILGGYP